MIPDTVTWCCGWSHLAGLLTIWRCGASLVQLGMMLRFLFSRWLTVLFFLSLSLASGFVLRKALYMRKKWGGYFRRRVGADDQGKERRETAELMDWEPHEMFSMKKKTTIRQRGICINVKRERRGSLTLNGCCVYGGNLSSSAGQGPSESSEKISSNNIQRCAMAF